MVVQDAFSNERVMPRTIVAGDSYTLLVAPETWKLGERTIKGAVVRDKIDRTYVVDASELATALKSNAETRLVVHKM